MSQQTQQTQQTPIAPADVTARYLAVWNATDADERADLAARVFTDGVRYTDPLVDVDGRDALVAAIGAVQQQFAGWRFTALGTADGHHDQLRFAWELGPDGDGDSNAPAPMAGSDVALLDADGRIARVLGFLDRVPR